MINRVGTDDQPAAVAEDGAHVGQQLHRLALGEVADGRAGKEAEPRARRDVGR
jgi:hypothetical protein